MKRPPQTQAMRVVPDMPRQRQRRDVRCCPKKYAELPRVLKPLPCVEAVKDLARHLATLSAQQSSVFLNCRQPASADIRRDVRNRRASQRIPTITL
jgi:hypothetical protein